MKVEVTKVAPGSPILKSRPDVLYRAEIEVIPETATTFPNGEKVMLTRSVMGYGATQDAAILEAQELTEPKK